MVFFGRVAFSALQGPHHVAQKFRMTALPRKSDSLTWVPSGVVSSKSGAISPTVAGFKAFPSAADQDFRLVLIFEPQAGRCASDLALLPRGLHKARIAHLAIRPSLIKLRCEAGFRQAPTPFQPHPGRIEPAMLIQIDSLQPPAVGQECRPRPHRSLSRIDRGSGPESHA